MARTDTFKDRSESELAKLLAEKRESLRELRFSAAGARAKDPSAASKTRRDIARIMTALTRAKKHPAA